MAAVSPDYAKSHDASAWDAADGAVFADYLAGLDDNDTAVSVVKQGKAPDDILRVEAPNFGTLADGDSVSVWQVGVHNYVTIALLPYKADGSVVTTNKITLTVGAGENILVMTAAFIADLEEIGTDHFAVRIVEDGEIDGDIKISEIDLDLTVSGAPSGIVKAIIDTATMTDSKKGGQAALITLIDIAATGVNKKGALQTASAIIDVLSKVAETANRQALVSSIIDLAAMVIATAVEAKAGVVQAIINLQSVLDSQKGGEGAPSAIIDVLTEVAESANRQAVVNSIIDLAAMIDGTAGEIKAGIIKVIIGLQSMVASQKNAQAVNQVIVDLASTALEQTNRTGDADLVIDVVARVAETANRQALINSIIDLAAVVLATSAEAKTGAVASIINVRSVVASQKNAQGVNRVIANLVASALESANRSGDVAVVIDVLIKVAESGNRTGQPRLIIDIPGQVAALPARFGAVESVVGVRVTAHFFVGVSAETIHTIALKGVFDITFPLDGLV